MPAGGNSGGGSAKGGGAKSGSASGGSAKGNTSGTGAQGVPSRHPITGTSLPRKTGAGSGRVRRGGRRGR